MRTIARTISIEDVVSRMPGVTPAYGEDGVLYYFDLDSVKAREYKYPTNYGMFPIDLRLRVYGSKESGGYVVNFTNDTSNSKTYAFGKICHMYHFLSSYYDMLNNRGHCGRKYLSAVDFFNGESLNGKVESLPFGNNIATYEEMDKLCDEYYGHPYLNEFSNLVCDAGMFEFLSNSVFPHFQIQEKWQWRWKTTKLYYADAIKWYGWFEKHFNDYYDIANHREFEDCMQSDDCCICKEAIERGGNEMRELLGDWLVEVKRYILSEDKLWDNYGASINLPIPISNSCDNLGNETIGVGEYRLGEDYSSGSTIGANDQRKVLSMFGDGVRYLNDNSSKGYHFDENYMEMVVDKDKWTDTLKYDIEKTRTIDYQYYAYKYDGAIVTGNTYDDIIEQLHDIIYMDNNNGLGFVVVDEKIVPLTKGELFTVPFGYFSKTLEGNTYVVYREEGTMTPYIVINDRKVYAKMLNDSSKMVYTFSSLGSDVEYPYTYDSSDLKLYYSNGGIIEVTNEVVYSAKASIDDIWVLLLETEVVDIYGDEALSKYFSGKYASISPQADGDGNYELWCEYANQDSLIRRSDFISGTTSSKLLGLQRTFGLAYDLLGNTFGGLFTIPSDSYSWIPEMYETLDLVYQVGNYSNLTRLELDNDTRTHVVGDIITAMTFFYKEVGSDDITNTSVKVSIDDSNIKSSLEAIEEASDKRDRFSANDSLFEEDVRCIIEYHIGATLTLDTSNGIKRPKWAIDKNLDVGIRYVETVRFKKKEETLFLKAETKKSVVYNQLRDNDPLGRRIKYPIYVYELVQEKAENIDSAYDTRYMGALATFECRINPLFWPTRPTDSVTNYSDINKYEQFIDAPTVRREFLLGTSAPQNVDSDIYIDRGMHAAFERHLKLGEVSTLMALEEYGNGFYILME